MMLFLETRDNAMHNIHIDRHCYCLWVATYVTCMVGYSFSPIASEVMTSILSTDLIGGMKVPNFATE